MWNHSAGRERVDPVRLARVETDRCAKLERAVHRLRRCKGVPVEITDEEVHVAARGANGEFAITYVANHDGDVGGVAEKQVDRLRRHIE